MIREASIEPSRDRLPGLPAQLGPFALLAAAAGVLSARRASLPDRVPVHWNFHGVADRFVARDSPELILPLVTGVLVCVLMLAFQLGIRYASPRHAVRGAALRVMIGAEYLAAVACSMGSLAALEPRLLRPLVFALMAGAIAVCISAFAALRKLPRGDERNPQSWHGPFYADRSDPALFVPKRRGYGYTVNLSHRFAPALILLMLALPAIAVTAALTAR